MNHPWAPLLASLAVYVAVTAVIGRDVLWSPGTSVANDAGDPILTASILHWNAHHVPLTDAWWQFPAFYRTPDALAFSEHLLGLGPIATPLAWITGSPLVTYNLTLLLTLPLSALAMYALVFRLTASAPGAFAAGLALGFAPYRIATLAHIQMQGVVWAPLALLGLHAYLDDGRKRWLALYGAAWALTVMSNGYFLVMFSLLVGLWTVWFVVLRGAWRALAMIAVATAFAAVPLGPILYKYVTVHAYHGFARSPEEVQFYSADALALFCAPPNLTFWGWLRERCRPEGMLFPGAAAVTLWGLGLAAVLLSKNASPTVWTRLFGWMSRGLFAVACVYAGVAVSVFWVGPWHVEVGPLQASAATVERHASIAAMALLASLALSRRLHQSLLGPATFYAGAAVVMWSLALGPHVMLDGAPMDLGGPYAWLMRVPGLDSLRTPARFWLMSVLCSSVVIGIVVARMLKDRPRSVAAAGTLAAGIGLVSDGWVDRIVAAAPPVSVPDARALQGQTVLELPAGGGEDIGASYRALVGGWTAAGGYSGNFPSYHYILGAASRNDDVGIFDAFQADGDLYVLVPRGLRRWQNLVEEQPGVSLMARNEHLVQYHLPGRPAIVLSRRAGSRRPIRRVEAACGPNSIEPALDGDERTFWVCGPNVEGASLVIDMGEVTAIGTFVHGLGRQAWQSPRRLRIDTSADGESWRDAWEGNTVGQAIAAALESPRSLDLVFAFEPRQARYVKVTNLTSGREPYWFITELEVWTGR